MWWWYLAGLVTTPTLFAAWLLGDWLHYRVLRGRKGWGQPVAFPQRHLDERETT